MSSPFTRIYPEKDLGYINLDGGLNSNFAKQVINNNETPDCLNVVFEDGSVGTREGTTLVNTATFGTGAIMGLYTRRDQQENETMVAWCNGSLFDLQTTSFITIASAQSVFTTAARVASAQYENALFFGDGHNTPYKWNGTDFTRHGVYPPTSTMTAGTSSAGTLTGDYQYLATYVNSASVESDIGPISDTFTAASEEVSLTSIPVAPQSFGISSRRIYRTEAGGSTFKLLATLNDNTTTTYTDNISDSALGAAAPSDQGVPPKYDVIAYGADRLFMNDPTNVNYVWYTELANPYVVKATNFRRFGDNSGNIVRGIVFYNNAFVIVGDERMQVVYMPSSDDSTWLDISLKVPYGSKSPFALVPFKDRLIFPATENNKFVGFGSLVGNTIEPSATFLTVLTAGGDLLSKKIEDQMRLIADAQVRKISAIAYKNNVYISISYGVTQTDNNRIYVLNYENDVLSDVQEFSLSPWTGLNAQQFTIYNDNLYYADNSNGQVFKMLDGTYNDNGSAINSYIWTKEFTGFKSEENFHKDFRYLFVLHSVPGSFEMDVRVRVDSDQGVGNDNSIDLTPEQSLYGTAVYLTDVYSAGRDAVETKAYIGPINGKRIQFKFGNGNVAGQSFKVFWMKFAYNLKGYRD